MVDRSFERSVDFARIVAAALQRPNLFVGPVCNQRRRLGIASEEVFAHVRAVVRLERLIVTVDAFVHQLHETAGVIGGEQRIPIAAPDHLDDVPA